MTKFKGSVKKFTGKTPWFYVDVPKELIPEDVPRGRWGFIKADIKVGDTRGKSSLLPRGGGKYFIALKASVRNIEGITLGDTIEISFWC